MRWLTRIACISFVLPALCVLAFVGLFIVSVAMSISQLPAWAQQPVNDWMLGTPQPVGRGTDDPGFGEILEVMDEEEAQAYDTVYDGPTPAAVGVGWADFVYLEDPSGPYGIPIAPFDRAPYINCLYHDPHYTKHTGVDIAEPLGSPVHASMSGLVVWAGENGPWGNLVVVENNGYQTYFAHLSEIDVLPGDIIEQGTVVGLVGSTGKSTGPHLHYGIKIKHDNGYSWVNPMDYFGGEDYNKIPCPEE